MSVKSSLLTALLASTVLVAAPAVFAKSVHASKAAAAVDGSTAPAAKDIMAKADADMMSVINAQASLHPKPIETLSPAEARKQPTPSDGVKLLLKSKGEKADPMDVVTKELPYGNDPLQKARIYMPADFTKEDGKKLPVIVYYHGGGFVIADLDVYDATPRALSAMVGAIVVSVEYRKAPEAKFPAQHDDAFAAYKWVLDNAAKWGGDASKVAAVGESAGGNLAIDTAIKARDAGITQPVHQVLVYPIAGVDMNTESYVDSANAKPLNKAMMKWFVKQTTKSPADLQDPRLDVIGKANVKGLPSTTIINAEIDPLRSDGELLAKKLEDAGVKVNRKVYDGATHEFFGMGKVVLDAKDAEAAAVADLKAAFEE